MAIEQITQFLKSAPEEGVYVLRVEGIMAHEIKKEDEYTPLAVEGSPIPAGRYTRVNVKFWVKAK